MRIILASHNDGKINELKTLMEPLNITVLSLKDLNDYIPALETGKTFKENADIKALAIAKKYQLPALSDDSGLEVFSLNNEPGIYSARYSGKGDYQNNIKLLDVLKNEKNRGARFISVLSYVTPDGTIKNYEGSWYGTIAFKMIGENGFGYDKVFIPVGYDITAAQMNTKLKNELSHRAIALKKFMKDFLTQV